MRTVVAMAIMIALVAVIGIKVADEYSKKVDGLFTEINTEIMNATNHIK